MFRLYLSSSFFVVALYAYIFDILYLKDYQPQERLITSLSIALWDYYTPNEAKSDLLSVFGAILSVNPFPNNHFGLVPWIRDMVFLSRSVFWA